MPAAMLTQDLLGVCLLLVNGRFETPIEEVLVRAEGFQNKNDRHFGISRDDLRELFWMLINWELKLNKSFVKIKLLDIALEMLSYDDVYFNDEGSHWVRLGYDQLKFEDVNRSYWCDYGYDKKAFFKRIEFKQIAIDFLKNIHSERMGAGKKLLAKMQIDEKLLLFCSRPGESH